MRYLAGLLLLAASSAFADVTVTVSSYTASTGQFSITIAGDPLVVEIWPHGGAGIDVCVPGASGAMVDDGGLTPSTTLRAGTTVCELMPHAAWPGARATVNGVTKDLPIGTPVVFATGTPTPAPAPAPVPAPPTGVGSAALSWNAPTTNTDGSPLTTLAGYKVYWSTTLGSYTSSATLNNPGLAGYIVQGLSPATYYFVVTAFNAAGNESSFSNVASKTIPGAPQPTPAPTPAPTPPDPCVVDRVQFAVNGWPGAETGRRSITYTSDRRVDVSHRWDPQRAVAVDQRGCSVTVTR